MNRSEGEAFLDGYRHGLGDAIRNTQKLHDELPTSCALADESTRNVVRYTLQGLMQGLRLISASVALNEDRLDPND